MDQENKKHICPNPSSHCCQCENCGDICKRVGTCSSCGSRSFDKGINQYWLRHLIVLIFAVVAAFFIGFMLGKMKGYFMAQYERQSYRLWPTHESSESGLFKQNVLNPLKGNQ